MATLHEILDRLWPGHGASTEQQPDGSYLITGWSPDAPQPIDAEGVAFVADGSPNALRPQPTEAEVLAHSDEVDLLMYREKLVATPVQLRLALSAFGLREAAEALVAESDGSVQDYWQYSVAFHRDHPLIVQFGAALGKTPEEIDAVFEAAIAIEN